jgi:protein SCO1/2
MNKNIFLILTPILILGFGATWVINKANSSYEIPIIKSVPEFSFKNQNGKNFTDKELNNKITVLDFIFTTCPGPCPMMTSNMSTLYKDFEKVPEVQFISITVDPENDTQSILKEYASLNGVKDDRWNFLFSDLESIKILKKDGFMLFADELPRGHAIKFILIDDNGKIRKYFDGTDKASVSILREDITRLVKKIRT